MINIADKYKCCGCSACVQRCPIQCIDFLEDEEGFSYPKADASVCVECGLCEEVCPVNNQGGTRQPLMVFAAINPDEVVREKSSSGGIFTTIAEKVINDGGVVFGAGFNSKWEVEHTYTETLEGISAFRGSKYVQSRIGDSYIKVEQFLKQGRSVLFSGTPCQIAGLNRFLRKKYDQLFTVDVVCHGVPSPKLWRDYLTTVFPSGGIQSISMKDKALSWRDYNITIVSKDRVLSERVSKNKYMMAFSQNLSLRPSCYQCPSKAGKSGSDISLADYWGIEKLIPGMDDDHGTSFVCANTEKGASFLQTLTLRIVVGDYSKSVQFNSCIENSTVEPATRHLFWEEYKKSGVFVFNTIKTIKPSIISRIIRRLLNH